MKSIAELQQQFGIPGIAQVVQASGGMSAVRVAHGGVHGLIYLHGAHVAEWHSAGAGEVLWISGKSAWQDDKPIRGGVPICFPWFGPRANAPASPPHGFVRSRAWELEGVQVIGGSVQVTMRIASDETTRVIWPHDFVLRHRVMFGPALTMSLELTNSGSSAITGEEALHTYFAVSDVRHVKVKGLAGARYIDKVDERKEKTQGGEIEITGETDRVYLGATGTVVIEDAGKKRKIAVSKENSRDTVVWNPWIAKAKAMADFGDDEWPGMICVETCNVAGNGPTVAAGQTHVMSARVELLPL